MKKIGNLEFKKWGHFKLGKAQSKNRIKFEDDKNVTTSLKKGKTILYAIYENDGILRYIGQTSRGKNRFREHIFVKSWKSWKSRNSGKKKDGEKKSEGDKTKFIVYIHIPPTNHYYQELIIDIALGVEYSLIKYCKKDKNNTLLNKKK